MPEVFSLLFGTKPRSWRAGKNSSGHGSYEPHFDAILKQDSSPSRFFVGSVCFGNLTSLHVGQWCVKRRVMLSNWGMANFVSSVSITPVKTLTCVNSVNNLCNVNLLYNIWIWKAQLIRRCPFQRAKYSSKVVICAGMESGRFAHGLFAHNLSRFANVLYVNSPTIHMLKLSIWIIKSPCCL